MDVYQGKFFIRDNKKWWEVVNLNTGQVYYFEAKRKYKEDRTYRIYLEKGKIVKIKIVPIRKITKKQIDKLIKKMDEILKSEDG